MTTQPPEQLLKARDERAELRNSFARLNIPSVSLNLNVPGFPKSNGITGKFFSICLAELKLFLKANLIPVNEEETVEITDAAGAFFIMPVTCSKYTIIEIKDICEHFEEAHALGRFTDVDVTDHQGNPVTSGKLKLCFFCRQKPADVCRHEGLHDPVEVREFMFSQMKKYCNDYRQKEIALQLSSYALQAVLYEISLTPKPGLVDKYSNGSHPDMNYETFLNSSAAISPLFFEMVMEGFHFRGNDLSKALPIVRKVGLKMETAMFSATHGVNTQKGLVFLMGLTLFACGYLFAGGIQLEDDRFREVIRRICEDITGKEMKDHDSLNRSHGEEVYSKYHVSGVRGEAELGFPGVFDSGLPVLLKYNDLSASTLKETLLSIASNTMDSNILFRRNKEILQNFQTFAKEAFRSGTDEDYKRLADYCIKEGISPGGSADLLVVSIFIYLLKKDGMVGYIL